MKFYSSSNWNFLT